MATATKTNGSKPKEETQVRIILNDATKETGTSGLKQWGGFITEAYNAALFYPAVVPLFARIRTSTPEIVMTAALYRAWSRHVGVRIDLPEDASDADQKYQDFILSVFDDVEGGFGKLAETMVNRTPFDGWGLWEAPLAIRDPDWVPPAFVDYAGATWPDDWRSEYDDGLIGIRRFAYRDTSTFFGWIFNGAKKAIGMKQQDFPNRQIILDFENCLHLTFGGGENPEGNSPLQAAYRRERIKYGYEVIFGIGIEHTAGHLKVQKTETGTLSVEDRRNVEEAAKNLQSAQEGNYGYFPFGIDGNVIDVPFAAAESILNAIKYEAITLLSLYGTQFIALNTLTSTGAQASQVDSTNTAVTFFNSMMDGFASQLDEQIGKRLWKLNKDKFPGVTKRPRIHITHLENNIALNELGSFLGSWNGVFPLSDDDQKAFRERTGFMPKNNPEIGDATQTRTMDAKPPVPDETNPSQDMTPKEKETLAKAEHFLEYIAKVREVVGNDGVIELLEKMKKGAVPTK